MPKYANARTAYPREANPPGYWTGGSTPPPDPPITSMDGNGPAPAGR